MKKLMLDTCVVVDMLLDYKGMDNSVKSIFHCFQATKNLHFTENKVSNL